VDTRARRRRPGDPGLDLAALSRILVVNAGSTSLKLSVVDESGVSTVVDEFVAADAVGHRIVHFGDLLVEAKLVADWLIPYIEEGAEVAPLHNQPALDALRRAQQALPNLPHVAVSDSYFHHTMPDYVRRYAVPADWVQITRHGFHGLAVRSIAERTPVPRLVVCHLGGGASVTAVLDGRSVDTTMGYTPLEGVPMATRSGSIDPGVLLYLLREGMPLEELDRTLNEESGLKALGGLDDPLGFAVYTYRVAQAVAGMAAALGGIDTLAFSGGVGENRSDVREAVAARLRFLGEFTVAAVPADEDLMIARQVRALLDQ
jgi:acetate kinase